MALAISHYIQLSWSRSITDYISHWSVLDCPGWGPWWSAAQKIQQPRVAHVDDAPGHEGAGVVDVHPSEHSPGASLLQQVTKDSPEALKISTQCLLHVSLCCVHWVEDCRNKGSKASSRYKVSLEQWQVVIRGSRCFLGDGLYQEPKAVHALWQAVSQMISKAEEDDVWRPVPHEDSCQAPEDIRVMLMS